MSDLQSRVYEPDPEKCCEACVFSHGRHAHWCPEGKLQAMKDDGRRPEKKGTLDRAA